METAILLEDIESPIYPVKGDLEATANLEDVVNLVSTRGLVENMSGLSLPNGSAPSGHK